MLPVMTPIYRYQMSEICPHEENVCYVVIWIGFLFCFHSNFVKDFESFEIFLFFKIQINIRYMSLDVTLWSLGLFVKWKGIEKGKVKGIYVI